MFFKRIRRSIIDLRNNYPEEFGRFIMSLSLLLESDDWFRICGIHGLNFKPEDPFVLCPTDPKIVSELTGFKEPMYCPHGVCEFLAWHTVYLLEFEFILNKYNKSVNRDFISLPWLDLSNISNENLHFMSQPNIDILFDSQFLTVKNPLYSGYIYVKDKLTNTKRNGWVCPKRFFQKTVMKYINQELNNAMHITNYESLSSTNINKKRNTVANTVPLEAPHGNCHVTVGGIGGSMSNIHTAAFDPIFWLHHCNIDRYFFLWMQKITNNFSRTLTQNEILPDTLNLKLAPFFSNQNNLINEDIFSSYKFGWENNSNSYILIKDILDFGNLNYIYETVVFKQNIVWEPKFIELVNIPIPLEPVLFNLYILPNGITFDSLNEDQKEDYLAGNSSWFGINRQDVFCQRCSTARTNISINVSNYLLTKNITKKNIKDYYIILNAHGLSIEDENNQFKTYSEEELVHDGEMKLILDEDDIISIKDFKFDPKSIHTRIFQSIITKLSKFNYKIDSNTDWDSIIKIKDKIESEWKLTLEELVKLKPLDKVNSREDEFTIGILKNFINKNYIDKKDFTINYFISNNFDSDKALKINNCIQEWERIMVENNIRVNFSLIDKFDSNDDLDKFYICFNYISIDGEYQICGNTYLSPNINTINIDIDKDENYSIQGLFEIIVKHELGHAFGLGHSSFPKSIMYPFVNDLDKSVSIYDIRKILA